MTAILKVDTIQDTAGNNIINESSDTITIGAAGDTVTVPGTEVKSNKLSPASGTALQIGDSGDTITIPSGATIANSGTATGFGGGKILQVVQGTSNTTFTQSSPTNGTAYYPSSSKLTASITPSSTSSKILVQFVTSIRMDSTSGDMGMGTVMKQIISGGSTTTIQAGGNSSKPYSSGFYFSGTVASDTRVRINEIVLLSPSTTSAISYEVGIAGYNVTSCRMNDDTTTGRIILMEVAV